MTVDSGNLGTWQIVKPQATTNYVTNPSFELDTVGWTAITCTMARVAGGAFGAYALRSTATAQYGRPSFATPSFANGTQVTISAWVRADSNQVYIHGFGATTVGAIQTHPGDGQWHRLSASFTMQATEALNVAIEDPRTSAWTAVDSDAVMCEVGDVATTYVDGDQDGCRWTGAPHASPSTRDGRDPRGGMLVSLASLGWTEKTWGGVGAPDVDTISQDYALVDGSLYQNQHAKPRVITLSALATASNLAGLHAARRALLDAINPNARNSRGPVRLRYAGAAVPKYVDAVNESGFGFDKPYHRKAEMAELRFLAPDPVWRAETDEQAALSPAAALTVGLIAQRGLDGTWGSMAGGVDTATQVYALAQGDDGSYYVGGEWTGGAASSNYLARYDAVAGTWSTVGGASPNGAVFGLVRSFFGHIIAVGAFTQIGASGFDHLAAYNVATNTWSGLGTTPSPMSIQGIAVDRVGAVWISGNDEGGPPRTRCYRYDWAGVWTDVTGTSQTGTNSRIAADEHNTVYIGNESGAWYWDGVDWVSIGAVTGASGANVADLAWGLDGHLYACGAFTAIGGVAANRVARWNGVTWEPLGSGIVGTVPTRIAIGPDGLVYVGGLGLTSAGDVLLPSSVAVWDGSTWATPDIFLPGSPSVVPFVNDLNVLTLGFDSAGTAFPPGVVTATNSGSATAYPVVTFSGTTALFEGACVLKNLTTGQAIAMDLTLQTGEVATLDLRPGRKTFTGNGLNKIGQILPSSDLVTFGLAPGANRIALLLPAANPSATMRWRPRYLSVD